MKNKIKILALAISAIALSHAAMAQTWSGSGAPTGDTYRTGNVGIGTNTPAEKLDVNGNITVPFGNFFGTSGTTYKKLLQTGWDVRNNDYLSFYTAGANAADMTEKMRITMSGSVGIGIADPEAKLHVLDDINIGSILNAKTRLSSVTGKAGVNKVSQSTWLYRSSTGSDWTSTSLHDGVSVDGSFKDPGSNTKTWWQRQPYLNEQSWGDGSTTQMILKQGRLGINWTAPSARLDLSESDNNYITLLARDMHTADGKYCVMASVTRDLTKAFTVGNNVGAYKEPFVVYGNGQTKIGIKAPTGTHADAMLAVDGKMVAKSIYVTQQNWADFVFDKDYNMPTLYEIETYYKANGHLPLIPSAAEVKENGVDLGEMNKLLLQKVEELTILMVEQEKRINALENNK